MIKPLHILLTGVILLTVAACGQKPPTEESRTPPAVQTEAVSETTAPEATVPETSEPIQQPVLHSGIREDGSFNSGTLFLGDSLTYSLVTCNLKPQKLLGDSRYAGRCGGQLTMYTDGTRLNRDNIQFFFTEEFRGMTLPEVAAAAGEDATAIYYMFGTNYTKNATAESYIEILDDLLKSCPNATIYLQTVPDSERIPVNRINQRILDAYSHYQQQGEIRVQLLDIHEAVGSHLAGDRVHLSDPGRSLWLQAIYDYADEHQIGE